MKIGDRVKSLKKSNPPLDVVFMNPTTFYNLKNQYFNMGLLYMATLLDREGYNVRCLGGYQLFEISTGDMRRTFSLSKPVFAGFYTISDNIEQVSRLARQVRRWSPGTIIIVGGPLATSLGTEIMDCGDFDMAVVGEGEEAMLALMRWKKESTGALSDIPGLIWREGGRVRQNPPAPPIGDLDSLPFPDYDLAGAQDFFHLVSGRGCPHNCIFCFQGVHGLKFRLRSVDNLMDEIVHNIEKYNSRYFDIIDDTFVSDHRRVMEFAKRLKKYREESGRDFLFFCQGRVDQISRHPEMIPALNEAGLARLQIGIESGDPDMLKAYRKKITIDQIKKVTKLVADTGGMTLVGNIILGGPGESEETVQASIDLAKELISLAPGVVEINAGFLCPYPGTPIEKSPERYGLTPIEGTFVTGLSASDVHMTTEHLDVNTLRRLRIKFYGEVTDHMRRSLKKIPRLMLATHYHWSWNYGAGSLWHSVFLATRRDLSNYFKYLTSDRFEIFDGIHPDDLMDYTVMRVQEVRYYSSDGSKIILPPTVARYHLRKEHEKLIYELSSGKITVGEMVDQFILRTGTDLDRDTVIKKYFIPALRKLDRTYQVLFFKM